MWAVRRRLLNLLAAVSLLLFIAVVAVWVRSSRTDAGAVPGVRDGGRGG